MDKKPSFLRTLFEGLLQVPCGQEVGPNVDGFVVHLEAAEDAVHGGAPRMSVTGDDAVLPEHLRAEQMDRFSRHTQLQQTHHKGCNGSQSMVWYIFCAL